jgi:flavodoxin/Fe-S-cluster-containing hydrogenase component 2
VINFEREKLDPEVMKSIVIYFSQTGNTRQIARAIQSGLAETTGSCDIVRLEDIKNEDLLPYDLIGLGAPVWHRREPLNVLSFIEYSMKSLEGKHAFVFCTHGLYPGHFIGRVVAALRLEGLQVIGWNNWYASCTIPEHPKPYYTDGHPDEIDLSEAREFGREMARRSPRVSAGEEGLIPTLPTGRKYHECYPGPGSTDRPGRRDNPAGKLELIDLRAFDFKVNPEKCLYPKCTLCVDNCPTASINFSVKPPIFRKSCDRCWFCEQICPRGAIEVDWKPIAEFVEKHIADDWEKVTQDAEKRLHFRRLVPPEKIGRKTYWWAQKKHPRLKPLR